MVLIGGAAATLLKGRGSLQDIDQMALMRPRPFSDAAARRVAELMAREYAWDDARIEAETRRYEDFARR